MSTPEGSLAPKNYIASGINKSLLTPCRRVGLSRTKKTPTNTTPTPQSAVAKAEDTPKRPIVELNNSTVKVGHSKRHRNNTKINNVNTEDAVINAKCEETSSYSATDTASVKENTESNSPVSSPVIHKVTVQVHQPAVVKSINFKKINSTRDSFQTNKLKAAQENNVLSDTGCHVLEDEEQKSFIKSTKRKLQLETEEFNIVEDQNSDKPVVGRTTLTKFSTEEYLKEYSQNPKEFQKNLETGNAFSTVIIDDDDDLSDFMPNKNFKTKKMKIENNYGKKDKNYKAIICPVDINNKTGEDIGNTSKILKKSSSTRNLTISLERFSNKGNTKSYFEDSDDEMFTSSPESDKKQRENLLQLILKLEKEVKQKKETLERLKRVQVYKKIHSPVKVKESSEIWVKGCENALKDLLLKMQEHGPINMDILIKNLKIPDQIIRKLKLF